MQTRKLLSRDTFIDGAFKNASLKSFILHTLDIT